jgi:hypothetical protein
MAKQPKKGSTKKKGSIKRARSPVKPGRARNSSNRAHAPKRRPITALRSPTDGPAATQRFVSGLLIRGEAEKRDEKGKLPLNATHAIKKENPDGSVEVERVRFKTW